MTGTWKQLSYLPDGDTLLQTREDHIVFLKYLTPTHFLWVYYNADADEVVSEGGGTYTLNGNTYTEFFDYVHPSGSPLLGTSLEFEYQKKNGHWLHKGTSELMQKDRQTGEKKTIQIAIDEAWDPFVEKENIQP